MNSSLLSTKFFIPPPRGKTVRRTELCERLSEGLFRDNGFSRRLTLVSSPPGFGKTSLISEWLMDLPVSKAWVSLDSTDGEPIRFLACIVSSLQTIAPDLGAWSLGALQSPQTPSQETILISLINDLANSGTNTVLVLDDYHTLNSSAVDGLLAFFIDRLPSNLHIVLITREDPALPIGRYRARAQIAELRAMDLTFSCVEAEDFLRRVMNIPLSDSDIAALEARTEGWVAGLQLAALALQDRRKPQGQSEFIASFTGSHRFIFDYLAEEVLRQCPEEIVTFLLSTSHLERFCGALCDAVLELPAGTGRKILDDLDRNNLFLVPLDGERCWYRFHHLFAELLQQRFSVSQDFSCPELSEIYSRSSMWFEQNDLIVEAFRYAAASGNVARAEALIQDRRMPIHVRGVLLEVIAWLTGLPEKVKNERPSLWVKSATLALVAGFSTGIEEQLQAAESALQKITEPEKSLFGQISTARATLAVSQYRMEEAKKYAHQALNLLSNDTSTFRLAALWDLGIAHHFAGEPEEALKIMEEVFENSRSAEAIVFRILSAMVLGEIQEQATMLSTASETYQYVLSISGEHPQPNVCEAYFGLARIYYEWNNLEQAGFYAEQGLLLARQYDSAVDRFVKIEIFLAKLSLAKGNPVEARNRLAKIEQTAREKHFLHVLPEIASVRALVQLRIGDMPDPVILPLPSRIRLCLASGKFEDATKFLDTWINEMGNLGEPRIRALVLRALIEEARGNHEKAREAVEESLVRAEPGGYVRLFLDEGPVMGRLIQEVRGRNIFPDYTSRILAAFSDSSAGKGGASELISKREGELLCLLAEGQSNQEIADRLFISLHTVKVHLRNIFEKLGVSNRASAIAKARALGLLP